MAVIIHNCDSASSWTTNHATSFTADTGDKVEGTASLKHVATGGGDPYCYYDFGSPYKDLSSSPYLYLYYKSTTTNPSSVGTVSLWSDTTWTNGSWYSFNGYHSDWTKLTIDLSSPSSTTGAGVTLSNVRRIRIDFPENQTVTFWIDDIYADTPEPEEVDEAETLVLSEELGIYGLEQQVESDTLVLSEELSISELAIVNEAETLSLSEEAEISLQETLDLENDFRCIATSLTNVENKFNSCIRVINDIGNYIRFLASSVTNVLNDVRTQKLTLTDIKNDIRTVLSWQRAAAGGPISLGKTYIRVYINAAEVTDVDIDSINIDKTLSAVWTASFKLGRAFDVNVPTLGHTVEIKYNNWRLFYGYVTSITPSDNPDSITVNCQNEMWKLEETSVNFNVGNLTGETEYTPRYGTVQTALTSGCSFSVPCGRYVPQNIGCTDSLPNVITNLVSACGNYAWFVDDYNLKTLVKLGSGDILTLPPQTLGENLNLYHVLSHQFSTSIDDIVNQYLVLTGKLVYKTGKTKPVSSNSSGSSSNDNPLSESAKLEMRVCNPDWSPLLENKSGSTTGGYEGYDVHEKDKDGQYSRAFKCYTFDPVTSEIWTDNAVIPYLEVQHFYQDRAVPPADYNYPAVDTSTQAYANSGARKYTDKFTVDYLKGTLEFTDPHYTIIGATTTKAAERFLRTEVRLYYYKKIFSYDYLDIWDLNWDETTLPDNPEQFASDYEYPNSFLTAKVGDYTTTRRKILQLSGFNVQNSYLDWDSEKKKYTYRPGWNDIPFANQMANWELAKTAYKKTKGTITLTLDAVCYYGIDLTKRIMLPGVLTSSLNVTSLNYNMSDFTVELTLESYQPYELTVSYPLHPTA